MTPLVKFKKNSLIDILGGTKKKGGTAQPPELETGKPSPPQMIIIPGPLKKILQDDSDMINRQFKLPKLPPKATAAEIINQVVENKICVLKRNFDIHFGLSVQIFTLILKFSPENQSIFSTLNPLNKVMMSITSNIPTILIKNHFPAHPLNLW